MGYRSDVALALSKTGVEKFTTALNDSCLDYGIANEVKALLESRARHLTDPENGAELWYWEDIKWYTDYPDVNFIENFLSSLVDDEDYRFMRLGEDYEDVEVSGWFFEDHFNLGMTRKISFQSS